MPYLGDDSDEEMRYKKADKYEKGINESARQKITINKTKVVEKPKNTRPKPKGKATAPPPKVDDGEEVLSEEAMKAMDEDAAKVAEMAKVAEDVFQLPESVGSGKKLVVSIPIRDLK